MAPVVVDFTAATVNVHAPPGAPLAIDFTVPAAHDTGTWTVNVYLSHKATGRPPVATGAVSSFTDLTATASFDADTIDDLIPDGSWRFGGWWVLARDVGDGPVPWAKGPFVVDPKISPAPSGANQSIVFTAPGVAVVAGPVSLDDVVAALLGSVLAVETSARIAADADLQAQLTAEVAARLALGTGWQDLLDTEAADRLAQDAVEALARADADTLEADTRAAAVTSLQADITNEALIRAVAVAALQAAIDSEQLTRGAEDDILRGELTAEAAARVAADTDEATARAAADAALEAAVAGIGGEWATAVAAEADARTTADSALQAADTAEAATRAAADTAEAATRAAADTALSDAIDAIGGGWATAVDTETAARIAADDALESDIATEAATRDAADVSEAATRATADTTLQTNITAEAATRATADTTEATARAAGDSTLTASVAAETAARQLAVTNEAAARVAADGTLQAAVDAEVANRTADVGAEAAARAAGDLTLTAGIATEATNRAAADTAEASTRQSADVAITATVAALDAATLKKSGNLSDLSDSAAARTNLDVHHVPVPNMVTGRWYRCPAVASLTTGTPTLSTVYAMPKFVAGPVLIDRIGCEVTGAGSAGSVVRLGIWADDGTGRPDTLVFDAGTIDGTAVDVQEITVSQPLARGWYWFGAVAQVAAPVLRTTSAPIEPVQLDLAGTPTAGQVAVAFTDGGVTGALGTFGVDGVASSGIAVFVRCGPVPGDDVLLEDGTSFLLLEDGTSHLQLED